MIKIFYFAFLIVFGLTGFLIGRTYFRTDVFTVKSNTRLKVSELPENSTAFSCSTTITSRVASLNNPNENGVFGSIWNIEDYLDFKILLKANSLTVENWEIFPSNDEWTVIKNSSLIIASLLPDETSAPDGQEYFTIFLDRKTGQGLLQRNRMSVYINRQVDGFITHFSCRPL